MGLGGIGIEWGKWGGRYFWARTLISRFWPIPSKYVRMPPFCCGLDFMPWSLSSLETTGSTLSISTTVPCSKSLIHNIRQCGSAYMRNQEGSAQQSCKYRDSVVHSG